MEGVATGHGLPNSNQQREVRISQHQQTGMNHAGGHPVFNRRSIPDDAVESVWTTADGQPIRRIDWPGAERDKTALKRGSILFMPGRGDAYEKYLETLEQWHQQGWKVTAADWRGQAGSGRLGDDPVTGHIDDFSVWINDLAAFWSGWIHETPGPHVLVGHSMGGHLILRAVAEKRVCPDAVVLSAPMLDFYGSPLPISIMHLAAKLMKALGNPKRPAWKWSEKPGEMPVGRIDLLTHDKDRYDDELFWRDQRPELVMGPGSWGWVERAYASMRSLFAPGLLESVDIPVLLLGTSNDRLVAMPAIERAAARLPKAEIVRFGDEARHEILREEDAVRDRVLAAITDFLDRAAPVRG